MTNKEYILKITSPHKHERISKIISCLKTEPTIQTFGDIVNIIVPAKKQKNKIAVIAHHDLFPRSLGYNDNSSGVVTALKLQDCLPDNVELVFTDKEECGGLGCEAYLKEFYNPKMAINLDVVGLPGKLFYEKYGVDVHEKRDFTLKIPEHMEYYHHIPFNDSYILGEYNIPSILILTGKDKGNLIQRIFECEHCGKDDNNIDVISEETMDLVFETVKGMLNV